MNARARCLDSPQLTLAAQPRFSKRLVGRHKLRMALIAMIMAAFESPALFGSTYVVNSTADEPDADPADGVCQTGSGNCTVRAAIMQANFTGGANTIVLPAGTYTLTRVGYDDDALVGDLDIKHDLTIQGAGSVATIIDGNGLVTHDRVFHVFSTVQNVTLSGMTIRNGESLPTPTPSPTPTATPTPRTLGGGGLYIEGAAKVHLSDVIFDSNTGENGGGIYANFSSVGGSLELDHVILHANTTTAGGVGAGGGVFAHLPSSLSQFVIQDSQVFSNTADGTGGGLYVDGNSTAQWSIQRSQIYSNTAASGGGIGNFVPLTLSDSSLHDNHATFDGGAMEAYAPFSISRTTLDANSAGRFGGGIFNLQTSAMPTPAPSPAPTPNFAYVVQSTLSGNSAQYGGGIYHDGFIVPYSLLTLLNSTVSGNTVFRRVGATGTADGGGIYIYGGQAQLLNTTIASNRVQLRFPSTYSGIGGGLYITAGAMFTAQNSLIANNTRGNGINLNVLDDGYTNGTVTGELAYNLITTTNNFFITGPQGGNIVGQDPLLGPLQNNGGPTSTHALLPGSPAIDAGPPAGATDDLGNPLTIDQRGFPRPYPAGGRFDMGAFELQPILSIDDVMVTQSNSGTTSAVFTVSLSMASTQSITVNYATADGTGTTGGDYQAATGTLTFNPGETSKTITVSVNGDAAFDPTETFFVNLSNAGNTAIAKSQGTGTIVNNNPPPTPSQLLNISTRGFAGTGDNVMIGGFIINGTANKTVLLRAIGPTLSNPPFNLANTLQDPTLSLFGSAGKIISNDNWADATNAQSIPSALQPTNNSESAILISLAPGAYTAIVSGVNNGTGIGLIEVFDLDTNPVSKLGNISTRDLVETGDSVLIGGFIISGAVSDKVVVRAIGPSLASPPFSIANALQNPMVSLFDGNGNKFASNDDWRSDQQAEIIATGLQPSNDAESAIVTTLIPGNYTAIVQGVNGTTGVALVEVYGLN
jgi:CSLREA domain-containing protein